MVQEVRQLNIFDLQNINPDKNLVRYEGMKPDSLII